MMVTTKLFHAQRGNTALEYGMIAGATAVAIMAAVTVLGTNLGAVLCQTVGGLGGICPAQQLAQLAANNCNYPVIFTMSADGQSCDVVKSFDGSVLVATTQSFCAAGGGTWDNMSNACKTTSITTQVCVLRSGTFDANTGTCRDMSGNMDYTYTDPNSGEVYSSNGCPQTVYTYSPPSVTSVLTDTNGNLHAVVAGVILPTDYPKSVNTNNGSGTAAACSWQ